MPVAAAAGRALEELCAHAAGLHAASGGNLLGCFAAVPDPRDRRGRRHGLASVLAMCTAAALCGNSALEDVTAWVAGAGQDVLAALGCRRNALGACTPPHPDTIVRVLTLVSAQDLADHAGGFLAGRAAAGPVAFPVAAPGWLPAIAAVGKAVRGAAGPDGAIPYLLAAVTHGKGEVLAERLIGPKTNEVPEFAPLLRGLAARCPLAGYVITADAGHTVRAHATVICQELAAHYLLTVKQNTPKLWDALDPLDWASVPVQHETTETGHGRRERRTIQVTAAPENVKALFPHVRQVALIERYVTRKVRKRRKNSRKYKTTQIRSAVAVFAITSLDAREAAPAHLARYVRGQWTIENKVHQAGKTLRRSKTSRRRCGRGRRDCWAWRQRLGC